MEALWQKARKRTAILAVGLFVSAFPVQAQQGFFLNPAFLYMSKDSILKEEFSSSKLKGNTSLLNVSLAYMFGGGLLVGAKYIQDSYTLDSGSNNQTSSEATLSAAGLSLGFKSGPVAALVSGMALQAPQKKLGGGAGTTKVTYDGGGGTQLDVMYLLDIGGWGFGPQLTWRSLSYKKRRSLPTQRSDAEFVSLTEAELLPYISMFVSF